MSVAFDTLEYARRLEKTGIGREQAEAHVAILRDVMLDSVATKADVAKLSSDNEREFAALCSDTKRLEERIVGEIKRLEGEMKLLENRLIVRLGAVVAAVVGVLGVVFRIFI
jgi:hypothetical protein